MIDIEGTQERALEVMLAIAEDDANDTRDRLHAAEQLLWITGERAAREDGNDSPD